MEKKDLRIIYLGTPDFAVEGLKRLVEGGYNVVAVVTMPDKPVGRHQNRLQPSPVKEYALSKGLPVLQPEKLKDPQFIEQLKSFNADLQIVVAFRMLPEVVWAMPRFNQWRQRKRTDNILSATRYRHWRYHRPGQGADFRQLYIR